MPSGKNAWLTFLTFDLLIKIVIFHALLAVSMTNINSSSYVVLSWKGQGTNRKLQEYRQNIWTFVPNYKSPPPPHPVYTLEVVVLS